MKTALEIKKLSDIDLVEYVCNFAGDEVAYNEVVDRFIDDVQNLCAKICGYRKLHSHIGLQISHDALEKLRGLQSFDRSKLKHSDSRKAIINFIYIICVNLFNDHHNKENKPNSEKQRFYLDEIFSNAFVNANTFDNAKREELTKRLFKKLNAKEQKVLIADMEYKRHQFYLPDQVVTTLCKELNVSDSGLRKIRERMKAKFQKEIDVINGEQ